jgi:hypothetical protein
MLNHSETSSLLALRELRDTERRRLHDAEQARVRAESERLQRRQAEEQRARQEPEQKSAQAREAAESTRLARELETARSEIARLTDEVERSQLGQTECTALPRPAPSAGQWFGWLGLSAGGAMLVGALALWAAMRPQEIHKPAWDLPRLTCPEIRPSGERPPLLPAVSPLSPAPAPPTKPVVRPRPPTRPRPTTPPSAKCDGRDPLCGIDFGAIDDVDKRRARTPK